ncbi:MAG: hypothetical protein ACD_73C00054G0002 [uncultured bacterium]|nr:MAG: hypothetical protein ACD_73C00054G0002 [uncultured bacterium]
MKIIQFFYKKFLLLLVIGVIFIHSSFAFSAAVTEYQLKAAFLFHFFEFVEWPKTTDDSVNTPFLIGVLGKNPFGSILEETLRNKIVNDKPVKVEYIEELKNLNKYHILFISSSKKDSLPEIFQSLQGSHVLTVGETESFNEKGGIINFILQGQKVRFSINNEAAKNAGLKISSRLLQLATRLVISWNLFDKRIVMEMGVP